jgi:hypothetical protein
MDLSDWEYAPERPRGGSVPGYGFELPGVTFEATALVIERDLSLQEWQRLFELIIYLGNALPFWVGDALLWGERAFGDAIYQAADERGRERLQQCFRVSMRVAPAIRRADLSWSHHRAVASVDDPREQAEWLERAARERLRSGDLSTRIRAAHEPPGPNEEQPKVEAAHALRCPECGHGLKAWLAELGVEPPARRPRRRRSSAADPDQARTKIDRVYWDAQGRLDLGEER